MNLSSPVSDLYLVGPSYAKRLKRLGIETVNDLLYHFPFRYLDYSLVSSVTQVQPGETVSVRGEILAIKNEYTKYGKKIQIGKIKDGSGEIEVIWFNQPFLVKTLSVGANVSLSGKVDFWGRKIALISPEYEIQSDRQSIHTGRLVPVYHETYGVSSKWLRSRIAQLINNLLPKVEEFLPAEIIKRQSLVEIGNALKQIHFPQNLKEAQIAKERFAFEEMLMIQLKALQRKRKWQEKKAAYRFVINQDKVLQFTQSLPFELTLAQKKAIREIFNDLTKNRPMNRLLEGDVGSGKTVVAASAILVAFLNGCQSALMAPTEILANQHFQTLNQLLTPLGLKIGLLTGAKKKIEDEFDLLVGTHALIHKRGKFKKLGLIIIDEQHRFGVEQRGKLLAKSESANTPHILTMTATPIPRTIALTLYGDLDLSLLDEMPTGRIKVKTWVVPPQKRMAAYDWIRKEVTQNQSQVFIICPLIEESEIETLKAVKAVTSEFRRLKKEIFPDLKLELLHGRLKSKEKTEILQNFRKGTFDILVSTPVVEVGIDVPNATIMLIEGAERFGLAALHQLRGRVGRSNRQSYCLLFAEHQGERSLKRLRALQGTEIGMKLAELDLQIRGPGELYGTQQHGFMELKVASFSDLPLIRKTGEIAEQLIDKLDNFPLLKESLKEDTISKIEPN